MAVDNRLVDHVMQGYGRFKPADRNTVVKYLTENPEYAALVQRRVTGQGGGDDRYENVQDSQALKTLMRSVGEDTNQTKATGNKAGKSAASKSGSPKNAPDTKMRGNEGLNPRQGMQSEAASDAIANRQEADRESNRGKAFKNIDSSPQSNPQNTQEGSGVGTAAAGLATGGALGYLLNRVIDWVLSDGSQPRPGSKVPVSSSAAQPNAPKAGTNVVPSNNRAVIDPNTPIDVPYREIPQGQLEGPNAARALEGGRVNVLSGPADMLPGPADLPEAMRASGEVIPMPGRVAIPDMNGPQGINPEAVQAVQSMLRGGPQGPATDLGAVRGMDELAPNQNVINYFKGARTARPRVGKF